MGQTGGFGPPTAFTVATCIILCIMIRSFSHSQLIFEEKMNKLLLNILELCFATMCVLIFSYYLGRANSKQCIYKDD